jgi:hypothetical protein
MELSIHLSVDLSFYPSIYPSIHLSIDPSICLLVCLSICPFVHLSICLSIHPSIYLSIHLFIYPSIFLYFCLSMRALSYEYICAYLHWGRFSMVLDRDRESRHLWLCSEKSIQESFSGSKSGSFESSRVAMSVFVGPSPTPSLSQLSHLSSVRGQSLWRKAQKTSATEVKDPLVSNMLIFSITFQLSALSFGVIFPFE